MANYEITTKAGATYQLDLPDAMSETEIMDYFNNRYLPSLEQDTVNRPSLSEPSGDLTQFNAPVEQPSQATIAQMQAEVNPKDTSDFSRGFKTSYEQLPELGYGLEAGAYAIGESAFGEGGMLTQGKQEAVAKMIEAQKETQANAKQSDSFTYAYEKAKEGDFNALADTVQYGLGYGLGQMSQAVITGGLGSTVAKTAAETFAKEYTAKLVEQEALKVAEQTAARELTQEQIQQQAVKNVTESIANKGRDYALGAQAVGLEGGEILGDLAKQSTEQNRSLTAGEVTRGLGATALAAAGEFYADRFGLDILGGKRLSEAGKYTEGLKGNLLRGAATGVKGGFIEGGTEFGQTLVEEAGKGKNPFSSESFRQAIDAAALGSIGGGGIGAIGGALSSAQQKPDQPATGEIDPSMLSGGIPNSNTQTTAQQPAEPVKAQPSEVDIANASLFAKKRLAELKQRITGTEDTEVRDFDGTLRKQRGIQPEFLTPEMKTEIDFLEKNSDNGAAVFAAYNFQPTQQNQPVPPAETSSKWQETMGKIRGIVGENQLVDNETVAKDVMGAETIEDAIAAANHATDAIAFDYDMNMEQAATLAQDLTKTDTEYLDNKDYQDAVQLENQLSTVRDQLAYNKFQTAFEESNQQASRAEFNALVEQEINNKNQQLKDLIQYQSDERARKAEVEASVPSINKALEDAQWAKTRNNRNAVIQMVFDRNVPAENIFPAIKAELKRQGFKDTELSQDDIDSYNLLKAYDQNNPTIAKEPVSFGEQPVAARSASDIEFYNTGTNKVDKQGNIIADALGEQGVNAGEQFTGGQGQDVVTSFVSPETPVRQESDALRKVDEWVNNGATYKNGMLFDSKGKKFLLNKAQREYYLTNKSLLSVAKSPVALTEQGYSETRQGQDTITGASSFNTQALKEVLDAQIKERVDSNRENRNLSSVNQRIEEQQWIRTRNNRNAAIQSVFDKNVSASNIESAIKAELKRQGFKDTELSEDDINAYELLQSAYARREPKIANAPVDIGVQQPVSSKRTRLVRQGVNAGEQVTQGQQGQDVVTNFVEPSTPVRQESDSLRKVDEWLRNGATYKNGMLIDAKGKKFLLNKAQRDYYLENRATPIAKEPVDMGEVGNTPRKRYMGVKQQGVNAGEQITGSIGQDQISGVEESPAVQPVVKKKPTTNNLNKITGLEPIEVAIGKLGGINREMANRAGFSDFKGRYFTKTSSEGFDGMALRLADIGYDVDGENDLIVKLRESLDADFGTGKKVYTFQGLEHQMALDQAEEFKAFEAEQKELAKELLKVASGNPTTIEEIQAAETPEDFDQLLTNIVTLSEDEADDFWNSIGEENADQTTKDASIGTIKENAPEILSTYTQQEVTQREEAQKAAEKEQAVKDAAAERKRQADNQVDSVVDEMLGRGMTTTKDIFAPERKPKFSKAKAQERLAPNGKPSNLNATQYEQVRTPEFKEWFGDWENDPENASKVVDENGEPLVVYHGTDSNVNEFITTGVGKTSAAYFTNLPEIANTYVRHVSSTLYPVFLNIKKIVDVDANGANWNKIDDAMIVVDDYEDSFNDYIGAEYGEEISTDDIVNYAKKANDGAVIRNVVDMGSNSFRMPNKESNVYAVFNPNQIKSATGNTGAFSKESNDIRFSQAQESADNHTKQSLKEGLTQAGDDAYGKGWTDRLLSTGMFEIISDADAQAIVEEAAEVSYSKNGDIEAFFNPADGKTYFVAENIDKATDLHYLMMHEVGVHALNMGGNKEEFESILKQVDNLVKVKNPAAMQGRQDALDADTPQEDLREETLAYLLKYAPKLKVVERFKAWLKNALRNMSKMFPAAQKLGFIQWANKLSDQDLLYIANATLRKAPEMLSKSIQPQYESDAILAAKAENRSLIVGNLERLKGENPDAHQAVMDYLDRIPEDELKRVSDNLEEFKGTPWAMVAVKSMVIRQIYHLSENYESNKDAIDKLTSGTLWGKDDISRYATLKVFLGKDREKKIQLLGKAYDFVGDNRKAENDVAGSFINCDPSKACAEHCYAALANGRPSELLKAEYTEYMASKYPEILANRIYDQYSVTAAFKEKLTLRLNDKGELSPAQLKVIELLNEKGVVLQVFSKRPELLKQVNDRNLKMLSIDTTNFDLALNNPEFKLAITLTDDFTPEMIAKVDDRVSVYLPVNLKGKEWSREKLREMYPEKYKNMSKRICPVDSENVTTKTGTSFVQVLNKEAKGLWTCTTCDKLGTVGCFKGFNTEKTAKYVSATSIGNLSKEKALAKKQDDISSMLSEFKQMEGIDNDTYRKIIELLSKRPSELSESNEQVGDRATENKNIKQNGGNIQEGTGTGETTGTTSDSLKFSKKESLSEDDFPPTQYDIDVPDGVKVNARQKLIKLETQLKEGKITEAGYRLGVQKVIDLLERQKDVRTIKENVTDRRRGADWIIAQMRRGLADGTIPRNEVELTQWVLENSPHFANQLGFSFTNKTGGNARGQYNPVKKVITLFVSKNLGGETATHEILHHTESMMSEEIQSAIVKEWQKAIDNAYKSTNDPKVVSAINNMMVAALGSPEAQSKMISDFREGTLNYDEHYMLYSPSEYWAVNGARILRQQFESKKSWISKAAQWLREFSQKIKSILGLPSDHVLLKSLEALANGNGEFINAKSTVSYKNTGGLLADIDRGSKEGKIVNRSTGYTAYDKAKPIPEEVDNKANYPEGVSLEEERDWVMQQLRRFDSFRRLNDKSNELINKYLTTMGRLPELGNYLGLRYQTLGKIDNVDDIVRNVFDTLQKATKEDSKEIYTYLTDNKATTEFIIDPQMALMAKDLKEAITIIGKKLVEFNIIPMESFQMYEGRYLPRVYLEHIIQSSDRYQSLGSGKTLSPMGYAKRRDNNLPEEFRRLIKGEIKNTAYLASRTLSIPLRDIAMMEFFNQISDNEKWVWKQSLINIELDAKTNRPTAIFDDDGVINYKATNSALEGAPKKIVIRKVTPYFLDKEADRILDQSYSAPEEDRKDMQDLANMMKRAASQAMVNMDAVPADFMKMPNIAKYGSLRGLVVHKLIYDDLVGTINTYGAAGEQTALENFFGNNGVLAKVTSAFKFSHVAINIPTQVTNLLSNGLLLHMSGVRFDKVPVRVTQAFREVLNEGENYKKMIAMGGRKATFSNQELSGITEWLLENEAEFSDKNTDWFSIVHIMRELSYLTGKTVRGANNLHQNIEMVFKVAKFIDMKAKGANDETAAVMAHQALFDYSFIPRWAKWLRTVPMGIPFITWTIKSFEATLRTAANRPTTFLPYYMLGYAMSLAAGADFGDDGEDKLKAILKLLPERMQRGGSIWILPIRDDAGRTQLIDMKNLFPWGKTAEAIDSLSKLVGNQDVAELRNLADSVGVFSSPITQAVVAINTNKDAFTGKQIVDENDPPAAKLQSILEYTYGMMSPPMLGGKGDIATLVKSQFPSQYEGIMNKDGSPKKTEQQAFIHLFTGLSIKSVDSDFDRRKKIDAFNNMITGIKAQRTRELRSNPNLSEESRRIVREKYDARIERVKEKKQKFKDETDILK